MRRSSSAKTAVDRSLKSLGDTARHRRGPLQLDFRQHRLAGRQVHLHGCRGAIEIAREFGPLSNPASATSCYEASGRLGRNSSPSPSPLRGSGRGRHRQPDLGASAEALIKVPLPTPLGPVIHVESPRLGR